MEKVVIYGISGNPPSGTGGHLGIVQYFSKRLSQVSRPRVYSLYPPCPMNARCFYKMPSSLTHSKMDRFGFFQCTSIVLKAKMVVWSTSTTECKCANWHSNLLVLPPPPPPQPQYSLSFPAPLPPFPSSPPPPPPPPPPSFHYLRTTSLKYSDQLHPTLGVCSIL
jgi:hypothetical protein